MSPVHTTTPDEQTLVASATVDAEPGRVFAAFTEAGELETWMWPRRIEPAYRVDARDGGGFEFSSEPADLLVSGRYLQVEAPKRLVMTWQWRGDDAATEVIVELIPVGAGTRVVITHGLNPDVSARDLHVQGWRDCLTRLVERFAG